MLSICKFIYSRCSIDQATYHSEIRGACKRKEETKKLRRVLVASFMGQKSGILTKKRTWRISWFLRTVAWELVQLAIFHRKIPRSTKKRNMPSKLRIGTEVSSTSSKTAPLLPAEPGKKRRRRQRVYGVVKRSLPNGKWEVEWGDGQIEACAPGILKCMASASQATNVAR